MTTFRSESIRKYFTKTPLEPEKPVYEKPRAPESNFTKTYILGFIAFLLIVTGALAFIGLIFAYFSFRAFRDESSKSLKIKERHELEKKDYEEVFVKYQESYSEYEKAYKEAEPKPTDEQMDQWMREDLEKIKEESKKKLGSLDEDDSVAEIFIIGGPSPDSTTRYTFGKDGKFRYSRINVLIVDLKEHKVASYDCHYDLIDEQTWKDTTQEFPYKEISNLKVESITESITLVDGKIVTQNGRQRFTLYTTGGNDISVNYSFSNNRNEEFVEVDSERTITAIRTKLKEYTKKYKK